jgi:hypothetical protein
MALILLFMSIARLWMPRRFRDPAIFGAIIFNHSVDFKRALNHFQAIPQDILPGRLRGNATALVVLTPLRELDSFCNRIVLSSYKRGPTHFSF